MTFLELEQICKKRRKKRIIILLTGLLFIVVASATVYLNTKPYAKIKDIQENKSKNTKTPLSCKIIKQEKDKNTTIKDNNPTKNITKTNITVKKNKTAIKDKEIGDKKFNQFQENNTTKQKNKTKKQIKLKLILDLNISRVKTYKTLKKTNDKNKTKIPKDKLTNQPPLKPEIKKHSFIMKTKTLPPFDACMIMSKKFYREGKYKEALEWAKNANIQNNKKPDSWIMSAKSLYKLGKKEEAIKILKIYYNYQKDKNVLKLLKEFNENN